MQEECVSPQPPVMLLFDPLSRIGFGRYQWQLFCLSGLGWLADSEAFLLTLGTRF